MPSLSPEYREKQGLTPKNRTDRRILVRSTERSFPVTTLASSEARALGENLSNPVLKGTVKADSPTVGTKEAGGVGIPRVAGLQDRLLQEGVGFYKVVCPPLLQEGDAHSHGRHVSEAVFTFLFACRVRSHVEFVRAGGT